MTLAYGKFLNDPILLDIASQHGVSTAQIALAWALNKGYAVIPSSTKREHLISNLQAQNIQLNQHEMQAIASLERNGREVNPEDLAPEWDDWSTNKNKFPIIGIGNGFLKAKYSITY